MIAGMAAFAVGDLLLKLAVQHIPLPQVVLTQSIGGTVIFLTVALARREQVLTPAILSRPIVIRNLGEVFAVIFMTIGIAASELSTAAALMQILPLVAVLGAVVFLGERVGWRRWASVFVGFLGVLIIVRPAGGIEPGLIAILIGVLGLAARDLSTRLADQNTSSLVLAVYSFAAIVPVGVIWLLFVGGAGWPNLVVWAILAGLTLSVAAAIFFLTVALRSGEVSAIIPFRYTRLIFVTGLAIVFLGERPDRYVFLGGALIIGSGLYALWRERQAKAY